VNKQPLRVLAAMLAPPLGAFMRRVPASAPTVRTRVCARGAGRIAWRSHQTGEPSVTVLRCSVGVRVNCAALVPFRKWKRRAA